MKAQYIESPNTDKPKFVSIFLAGTISGAPDWQKDMTESLSDLEITIFNPRRPGDIMKNNVDAKKQIEWEHERLQQADVISFYFSPETLNPITLFELGRYSFDNRKYRRILVGVHPDYARKFDVVTQMELVGITPVYSLETLTKEVHLYLTRYNTIKK